MRMARHMTQEELAEAMKTQQSVVSRIEGGKSNVEIRSLEEVAKALGVSVRVEFEELK